MMRTRKGTYTALAAVVSIFVIDAVDSGNSAARVGLSSRAAAAVPVVPAFPIVVAPEDGLASSQIAARHQTDLAAMQAFRPGYEFWQNIFAIPDGSIVFGSAADGRRLVAFPAMGNWSLEGTWADPTLSSILDDRELPDSLDDRREIVAGLLEPLTGPVLHNPTRGGFVVPGIERYGRFLSEWGAIYERFGVPAEIGLAQALVESGFEGTRRSEAGAVGLCQWLGRNWKYLDRLAPSVIEVENQTTQAAYCGAYLSILATKYGSFIPALSEHHAGATNVGRTLINGQRLGGANTRERYFLGASFARDLRTLSHPLYSDIYGTYGPRSYFYAEMVFGNTSNVQRAMTSAAQSKIHAMRTRRSIPIAEITRRTGLSVDSVRRFNPALVKRVPADSTLYLPKHVSAFGRDVAFWQKPASAAFASVLNDFVRLDVRQEAWDDGSFDPTLEQFEERFRATKTEEGTVMATVLAYVRDQSITSGRREILSEFRRSQYIRDLFDLAVRELAAN